ncbi:OmpP1/FadL family transporter [Roseiconus nitratireducens]|nr:outer membrane protein transport protein [Roseiconus nitratireducens]
MSQRLLIKVTVIWITVVAFATGSASQASAQTFGIELHNTMMPASGGMAGASLARPQDLQSAIYGNPATLTQFKGTQFSVAAGWAEPTINIDQQAALPLVGVTPYAAKSDTPGSAIPNIGVTQDVSALGLPITLGMGLMTNAGLGSEYRGVPESGGTSSQYLALDVVSGLGVELTERLSVGATVAVGSSYLDGPFVDLAAMTSAYGLRGTFGVTYQADHCTTLGAYWQTRKSLEFENAVLLPVGPATARDLDFDHPENFGLGLANQSLMNGRLLLAMDVLFKRYSDADFFSAIYDDQWVYQFGAQYALNQRVRLRAGYAYNENPMRQDATFTSIGGVPLPDGVPALRYIQGQFAAISQHRITGGIGVRDVLPGIDFDLYAGGMFENTDRFATTFASVEGYWLGAAVTWRFGRGADHCLHIPDSWD